MTIIIFLVICFLYYAYIMSWANRHLHWPDHYVPAYFDLAGATFAQQPSHLATSRYGWAHRNVVPFHDACVYKDGVVTINRKLFKLLSFKKESVQNGIRLKRNLPKEENFGNLDVLVNNAGLASFGTIRDGNILEAYDVTMNVNVRAVINLTTLATLHLIATKGNMVNVSSVAAMKILEGPEMLAYYVSKAALDHFTRGAALELAPLEIRVNSVNPGPVVTDFMENMGVNINWEDYNNYTALNRISTPEEIAHLISFLASEKAIGVTGSSYVSDNGFLLKN